jgi:hypothetical protein
MVFPKVQTFTFRASSDSPLEVAAKALAHRNDHPHLWRKYSFSMIRKRRSKETDEVEDYDIEITDLRKSFGMLKEHIDQEELTLFYKINTEFRSPFKTIQ